MKEKINKLRKFVEKYAEDYLNDGTKDKIIEELDSKNIKTVIKIMNSIDKEWINEVKKVGKFRVFTDFNYNDLKGRKERYQANYTDSLNPKESHVPTLRIVETRRQSVFYSFKNKWKKDLEK